MRPWECPQTDRQTDTQTQTDFIICPMLYAICYMLYAIAMWQIIMSCLHARTASSEAHVAKARHTRPDIVGGHQTGRVSLLSVCGLSETMTSWSFISSTATLNSANAAVCQADTLLAGLILSLKRNEAMSHWLRAMSTGRHCWLRHVTSRNVISNSLVCFGTPFDIYLLPVCLSVCLPVCLFLCSCICLIVSSLIYKSIPMINHLSYNGGTGFPSLEYYKPGRINCFYPPCYKLTYTVT